MRFTVSVRPLRRILLVPLAFAVALSVASAANPSAAGADPIVLDGPPCYFDPNQCTPADISLVQPPSFVTAQYGMTSTQYTALKNLETAAIVAVIRRHGLTDSPAERQRLLLFDRAELRTELIAEIVLASTKAPSARTADDNGALSWFASAQQYRNVLIAQAAKTEYEKFAGASAYQAGIYPANSCTYTPPRPYASEYPGSAPRWIACTPGAHVGPFDPGPSIPSVDDFTRWGAADVARGSFTAAGVYLGSSMASFGFGALAGAAVTGAGAGAIAALPTAAAVQLSAAFYPYSTTLPAVVASAGADAATVVPTTFASYITQAEIDAFAAEAVAGGAEIGADAASAGATTAAFGAGSALGVAAIVIVAITAIVTRILQVVQTANRGQDMLDAVAKAQTTTVDPVAAINAPGGIATLFDAVEGITLDTRGRYVKGADALTPAPGGATLLQVNGQFGQPAVQRTSRLQFVSPPVGPNGVYGLGDVTYSHGWWVDDNPDASKRFAPTQAIDLYLRDPNPPVHGNVASARSIFSDYPARVTTIQGQDGRMHFLVTSPAWPQQPVRGSACADLANDYCWITDTLPVYDPNRSTGGNMTVSILPNTVDDFSVSVPSGITQGTPANFVAQRSGAPYSSDSDGDPVTITWKATTCPTGTFTCPAPETGASPSFTFGADGTYTFTVTASDDHGASTSKTVTFDVANAAPTLELDADRLGGSAGQPVNLVGTAKDGSYGVDLQIDWGDGATQASGANGTFSRPHTYARSGTYTVTVTAGDSLLTTSRQATVTISDTPPSITLNSTSKSPVSWDNLQPGTTISATGTVTDPDLGDAVTVQAAWYDGSVDTIVIPRGDNQATQTFSLQHTVKLGSQPNVLGYTNLVSVTASDASGATTAVAATLRGSVVNTAPYFEGVGYTNANVGDESFVLGRLRDANGSGPASFAVDWGDGTDTGLYGTSYPVEVFSQFDRFSGTHTYTRPGTYTVTLTATDQPNFLGRMVQQTLTFYIYDAVHPLQYAQWKTPPVVGQTSTLQLGISSTAAGHIHIRWGASEGDPEGVSDLDFGPGDQVLTVDHVFTQPYPPSFFAGTITVPSVGTSDFFTVADAVVANPAPPAPTLVPITGDPGSPVGIPLQYDDLGNDTNTVTVDWGDGTTADATTLSQDAPTQTPTHTYAATGIYHPSVTLTDTAGNTVSASTDAVIGTILPVLGPVTVGPAFEGRTTTVSATSVDPLGRDSRIRVDWGDGTTTTSDPATTADPRSLSHVYVDNGRYPVSVVALDPADHPSAASTTTVAVRNLPPTTTLTAPATADEGSQIALSFTVRDPGVLDTGTATVDWGDGTNTSGLTWTADQRALSATHTYVDDDPSGTPRDRKRISVVVIDNGGDRRPAATVVEVRNVPPTVRARLTDASRRALRNTVPAGSRITASVQVTDPGVADTESATLVWGDGTKSTTAVVGGFVTATHVYATAGRFPFHVAVADDDLGSTRSPDVLVRVVAPTDTVTRIASVVRRVIGTPPPQPVLRALRAANASLIGPPPAATPNVRAALTAGDRPSAVGLLAQAAGHLADASAAGATGDVQQAALDAAVLARALLVSEIAAHDPASQPVADANAVLATLDQDLVTGNVSDAFVQAARVLTVLNPPTA